MTKKPHRSITDDTRYKLRIGIRTFAIVFVLMGILLMMGVFDHHYTNEEREAYGVAICKSNPLLSHVIIDNVDYWCPNPGLKTSINTTGVPTW